MTDIARLGVAFDPRYVPIKVKRLHPDAVVPQYQTEGAAGFDLHAVEDVVIEPGETVLVRTGLAFELPHGYEMQIRPRSGVSLRTKLRIANAPGTVDADFRGEVGVIIENTMDYGVKDDVWFARKLNGTRQRIDHITGDTVQHGAYIIRRGDRICQGVISEVPRANFIEVIEVGETERGDGGFGSTGTG